MVLPIGTTELAQALYEEFREGMNFTWPRWEHIQPEAQQVWKNVAELAASRILEAAGAR